MPKPVKDDVVCRYDINSGFYRLSPRKYTETELSRSKEDVDNYKFLSNVLVANTHSCKEAITTLPLTDIAQLKKEHRKQALSHRNYKTWLDAYCRAMEEQTEKGNTNNLEEGESDRRPRTSSSSLRSSRSCKTIVPPLSATGSVSASARLHHSASRGGISIRSKTNRTGRNEGGGLASLRAFDNGTEVVIPNSNSNRSGRSASSTKRSNATNRSIVSSHSVRSLGSNRSHQSAGSLKSFRSTRSLKERTMKIAYAKELENGDIPPSRTGPQLLAYTMHEGDDAPRIELNNNFAPEFHQDPTPYNRGGQVGDWVWKKGFGYVYNAVPNPRRIEAEKQLGKRTTKEERASNLWSRLNPGFKYPEKYSSTTMDYAGSKYDDPTPFDPTHIRKKNDLFEMNELIAERLALQKLERMADNTRGKTIRKSKR